MHHLTLKCLLLLAFSQEMYAQQYFPPPRVGTGGILGGWLASPIVAIGEIDHIRSYGHQTIAALPPPTSPEVHNLYWCLGDFHLTAILKRASHQLPKQYLWATTIPGCQLWRRDPELIESRHRTRAWFLREEANFLRPTFDYGTNRYVGITTKWNDPTPMSPREKFGRLLLTPSASGGDLETYGDYLWEVGDIACELLGKSACAQLIRGLEPLGNAHLRESACKFLKFELLIDDASQCQAQ